MRSSRNARDSSCRTRSRVMPSTEPTSSRVFGGLPVESEAERQDAAQTGIQLRERRRELACPQPHRGSLVGRRGVDVLDQVAVEALAVADRRLEADRILDELEQVAHAVLLLPDVLRELGEGRLPVELLGELAAGAQQAPHLLGDVHGQPDRSPLVGERARHRLPDPPGGVGRELVAEPVVELLHRADQAEVALLDQVEERHAGLRVVPCDRHHEPEVRLDQPPLRLLVARVLSPGELALLGAGQQRTATDLAHVQAQRVLGRRLGACRRGLPGARDRLVVRLVGPRGAGDQHEVCVPWFVLVAERSLWERLLLHRAGYRRRPQAALASRSSVEVSRRSFAGR